MIWAILLLLGVGAYGYVHLCVRAVLLAAYDQGSAAILLFWGAFALECRVLERDNSIRTTKFQYSFYPTFLQK